MQDCLENRKLELVHLTEVEFLEFLDHAETCQYHAVILEEYEADMLPLVKLAFHDISVDSFTHQPIFIGQNLDGSSLGNDYRRKEAICIFIKKLKENYISSFCLHDLLKFPKTLFASFLFGILSLIIFLLIFNSHRTNDLAISTENRIICPDKSACVETPSITLEQTKQMLKQWNPGMYKGKIAY